jgi:hypothetical protein
MCLETDQSPRSETKGPSALQLPAIQDRFIGKSLVSVVRRVPSKTLWEEDEIGHWRGSLSVLQEDPWWETSFWQSSR